MLPKILWGITSIVSTLMITGSQKYLSTKKDLATRRNHTRPLSYCYDRPVLLSEACTYHRLYCALCNHYHTGTFYLGGRSASVP